jgi:hypothetical protein
LGGLGGGVVRVLAQHSNFGYKLAQNYGYPYIMPSVKKSLAGEISSFLGYLRGVFGRLG